MTRDRLREVLTALRIDQAYLARVLEISERHVRRYASGDQAMPMATEMLLEAAVADHERSTGPWEIEWISLPEIFLLTSGALAQTKLMLTGLEVDADRMRANLDLTRGTIVSEAVMMGLGPHLGRQRAHDLVYDICRKVASSDEPLVELLARNEEISRHLTRAQLEKMCDPAGYLGLAGEMVDKVLAREGRMDR